jgi:excinuclease ABC subunit C
MSGQKQQDEDVAAVEIERPAAQENEASAPAPRGIEAIRRYLKTSPVGPGVYRMLDAEGAVLYVGKARSIRKRVTSYARPQGQPTRIARMIAETASMEFVSTATETEALLLEANLIKRLRPRFNVQLRDDKSFPYILIATDHPAPRIVKHRGGRSIPGHYFGPFASAGAVNRTVNALQRAFFLRSCTDSVYQSRTRPCLLFQIKRCSAPCTGEIDLDAYARLVGESHAFLSGRSQAVKAAFAQTMEEASATLDFERAALYRDRLAALSAVQGYQGVNPRTVEEADLFAIDQQAGQNCIEVFFFRNCQNWGNHAYFPRADKSLEPGEVLGAFLAQFYDDKPVPKLILLSHEVEDQALLAEALCVKSGRKVEIAVPQRGERRELVARASANAREALGRRLAESSSQAKLLDGVAEAFGLPDRPRRIEVYDNSHIMGSSAVGAMVVAGPEGLVKGQYRKFNIRSDIAPGDDYGMMREVLKRRFARLIKEEPRPGEVPPADVAELDPVGSEAVDEAAADLVEEIEADVAAPATDVPAWPDLVLIDGGPGQLAAAQTVFGELGIKVPVAAVAKGMDREAGRETFTLPGKPPFRLPPRDPVLYFVQRLRDEAHRFAIGSHRVRRKNEMAKSPLDEIPGIGPTRKRALLRHFGTAKAVSRAGLTDLEQVPGINSGTAKLVYDHFHEGG